MYNKNNLAIRVVNRVRSKLPVNDLLGLSDESLLEFAKDAATQETLRLSTEVNNRDTWQFSNQANSNASFQATFLLKASKILHYSGVLNRVVGLLKERLET